MTPTVFPDADQSVFILHILSKLNGVRGIAHWVMIDFFNHIARFEPGLGGGGVRLHLANIVFIISSIRLDVGLHDRSLSGGLQKCKRSSAAGTQVEAGSEATAPATAG